VVKSFEIDAIRYTVDGVAGTFLCQVGKSISLGPDEVLIIDNAKRQSGCSRLATVAVTQASSTAIACSHFGSASQGRTRRNHSGQTWATDDATSKARIDECSSWQLLSESEFVGKQTTTRWQINIFSDSLECERMKPRSGTRINDLTLGTAPEGARGGLANKVSTVRLSVVVQFDRSRVLTTSARCISPRLEPEPEINGVMKRRGNEEVGSERIDELQRDLPLRND
jgi:hypothetical protein